MVDRWGDMDRSTILFRTSESCFCCSHSRQRVYNTRTLPSCVCHSVIATGSSGGAVDF